MTEKREKVIVGMSGGVDSSVAAALLIKQGYQVEGVFMKNFDPNVFFSRGASGIIEDAKHGCHWEEDQEDARDVCATLGIPFTVWNFEKEYYQEVMNYFLNEYKAGRTPNPDVLCNRQVKFGVFFKKACISGADFIATGHYVRLNKQKNYVELLKGVDSNKDQSYFLYSVSNEALSKTLFPIGELIKLEVREIAKKIKFKTSHKKDSQGICFIGEVNLKKFLEQYIEDKPGNIIDLDSGEVIGEHEGLAWYTIGQRRGMSVGGTGLPLYVADKDLKTNDLYVVKGNHNPRLYKNELVANDLHWINTVPKFSQTLKAKIRYRQVDQDCGVSWLEKDKSIKVKFKVPQRAITPGQSVVLYNGDICLGGGIII